MRVPRASEERRIPPDLSIDEEAAADLLSEFIRQETSKAGLRRIVVGLSGGVDSATSAALACRALGPRRVLCVLLPYHTSSADSVRDARRVARTLKMPLVTIDISPMIDAYFKREKNAGRLRRGNKMARERMSVLYDLSSREKALVLGTSNKTELLLGYGTIFGDTACAINPLGDLYKTQVRCLALHLGVPESIVWKTASADLWTGQSDEKELGYRYADIDRLLMLLIDRRSSREEAIATGFSKRMVDRITGLIVRSQFKRRPPLIAKVSSRTVGIDFRYPRDWGR